MTVNNTPLVQEGSDGYVYDPNSKAPPFGHALKKYWAFDEGYVNLNHGSYGSLPLPVLSACSKMTLLAERNPDKFHRVTYIPLLTEARTLVADLIGARSDEVVFVPNTTHGINTVLRNFDFSDGDVILKATTTYGAVSRTIDYLSDRPAPARPATYSVTYTFPTSHEVILDSFRAKLREIKSSHPNSNFAVEAPSDASGGTRKNYFVAVIDGLTANPGVLMPWQDMVRICKEEGVWSVIDAAHSIGQEPNINLGQSQPDFWVSNCHKWLYVKRGCAVLYTPLRNQHIIKTSIPTSHEYRSPTDPKYNGDTKFVLQHEWTGTQDMVNYLSVKAALEFRKWLGGESVINDYCHKLAVEGGNRLAEVLDTQVIDASGGMVCSMIDVRLPLPVDTTGSKGIYNPENLPLINIALRDKLLERNTYVAHYFHAGAWWCRCSAQVWNEISDFEYVGKALNAICKDIEGSILAKVKSSA